MSVFAVIYCTTTIGDHFFFRTTTFDYGTYNFAFWDYSHFHISKCPVYYYQDMNFLQDHFSLTLMYYVPVYWLLNWLTGTYTLGIIQVAMLLVGGWATYRLIIVKTSDKWLGIAALLYYFLLQGHYSTFAGDCNVAVISAAFIPLFLYYFEFKKYFVASVFFVLALFSRENIPLWFISILPIVMLWHRKDKKILAICSVYVFISALYFILLFKVIIPHLETAQKHYSLFNYSALGDTPYQALKYILRHPINTFKLFFINNSGSIQFDNVKKEFYLVYLISGGFVLFFRPQYFIWFIPLVAQKMLNDQPIRWSIEWHYAIEVVTMLPIAVFVIVSTLKNKKSRYFISVLICLMTLVVTARKMGVNHRSISWSNTVKENVFNPKFFTAGFNVNKINKALALIPPDAKVSASASILPHLAQRDHIYQFPKINDADYIAAFSFYDYFEVPRDVYNAEFYKYVFSPEWNVIVNEPPFILLKKERRTTGVNELDSITCNNEASTPDEKFLIASNKALVYSPDTRDNSRVRHGKYSCRLTKQSPYGMTLCDSSYTAGTVLAISVWRYSENNEGNLVMSCGKDLYQIVDVPVGHDSLGWQQLLLYITVPFDHASLRVYVWNTGNTPAWFDDLKVLRYKGKLL
jgi:uncharacterized membrane protein